MATRAARTAEEFPKFLIALIKRCRRRRRRSHCYFRRRCGPPKRGDGRRAAGGCRWARGAVAAARARQEARTGAAVVKIKPPLRPIQPETVV